MASGRVPMTKKMAGFDDGFIGQRVLHGKTPGCRDLLSRRTPGRIQPEITTLEIATLAILLFLLPFVADGLFIFALALLAKRGIPGAQKPRRISRWLVLIPARNEGNAIRETLASIPRTDTAGGEVITLVVLDGDDPLSRDCAESSGASVCIKEPPGPSKGAVLEWVAETQSALLAKADAVLILDVGSRLAPGFFETFSFPEGADAVQAYLGGPASGVGGAIRHSEHFAQHIEDQGRQQAGWSVRLRGTGTALTPACFHVTSRGLKTRVEDLEASLVLAAAGMTAVLGEGSAVVYDEKPAGLEKAAVQRARWLAGRWHLLVTRRDRFSSLIRRRPLEGMAFLVEIWGRPLSLSLTARSLGFFCLLGMAAARPSPIVLLAALLLLFSIFLTLFTLRFAGPLPWAASASLFAAWLRSLARLPQAISGWLRAR